MKTFEELMATSPSSPFGLFTYYCDNLGDHIQTLALLQHVTPRTLLFRDHLAPNADLCLLANGWLADGPLPATSDFCHISYVGVHLAPHLRDAKSVAAMKECGVIGCRDTATAGFLSANGVPTNLCGCATLTFPAYSGKREGIFCVDVPDDVTEKVLRAYKDPVFVSHDIDHYSLEEVDDTAIMAQYRRAYALLMRYRSAELVITSRVHATLPCIAFGTPVIYVGLPKNPDDRVTVFDGMGVTAFDAAVATSTLELRIPVPINPVPLRERYLGFLQRCLADALEAKSSRKGVTAARS